MPACPGRVQPAFAKLKRVICWAASAPHGTVTQQWLRSHTALESVWRQLTRCNHVSPCHAGNWLRSTCLGTPCIQHGLSTAHNVSASAAPLQQHLPMSSCIQLSPVKPSSAWVFCSPLKEDEHAFPASAQKPSACDGQHVEVVRCRDKWLQFLHVAVEKDKANWLTLCSFEEDGPHVLSQLS